jgi:hypothetical protein
LQASSDPHAAASRSLSEERRRQLPVSLSANKKEATMPVILWLLGVPLSAIIVLALLGAF